MEDAHNIARGVRDGLLEAHGIVEQKTLEMLRLGSLELACDRLREALRRSSATVDTATIERWRDFTRGVSRRL